VILGSDIVILLANIWDLPGLSVYHAGFGNMHIFEGNIYEYLCHQELANWIPKKLIIFLDSQGDLWNPRTAGWSEIVIDDRYDLKFSMQW
jgi:hypothetical protein